jgi:hypothetical protein
MQEALVMATAHTNPKRLIEELGWSGRGDPEHGLSKLPTEMERIREEMMRGRATDGHG